MKQLSESEEVVIASANTEQINLPKKDRERREFVLSGNMWQVIGMICTPLAIYQSLNQIFKFLDVMMASHISSEAVSTVAYLSQISGILGAVGAGLAVGGSISIARYYGAGDFQMVKKQVSTLMAMAILVGLGLLVGIVPFVEPLLRLANTPEELIAIGRPYFIVELFSMVAMFINNVYIAIERARGNTKRILVLNVAVLSAKLILTAVFVYVLGYGVAMVAVATLLSHLVITLVGFYQLRDKTQVFSISMGEISFRRTVSWPMVRLALPVMAEKMAFSIGKTTVNAMSVVYGSTVVGALGVSNNIGGLTTSLPDGVQQGGASIISQNVGNNRLDRALDAFKKVLIVNMGIGVVGFTLTTIFMVPIAAAFTKGDLVFADQIMRIYSYERFGLLLLPINASVMALLYGLGYTKLSLLVNIMRLFVFRIPVLYLLQQFTRLGSETVGIAMMISNLLIGIFSGVLGYVVVRKERKRQITTQ